MSVLKKTYQLLSLAAGFVLLSVVLSACSLVVDGEYPDVPSDDATKYINITISVSAENNNQTRAPQGGEYGDGIEKGIDRENLVNNITLIFYQDNTGINTTSDDAAVLCVKQYRVRPFTDSDLPESHNHKSTELSSVKENEVLYTTGNQKLEDTQLRLGQSYKMLVVANANVDVNVGDKIKTVRDKLTSSIYLGSGSGIDAENFVMTSECDASVTLSNPIADTSTGENRFVYYFDCIHIERLAARIDYCTSGASYDGTYNGYVYSTGNGDFYVVTKVTPFNLYNESEYLFKRVQDAWPATATTYLGDESTTNYVVDPKTASKDNEETVISYLSPIAENMNNSYTQAMNSLSTDQKFTPTGGSETVIIAYPKENTIMPSSHLKKYATGLAFEVKYYASTSATPVIRTYYHYLRHQGELSTGSYQAKQWADLSDTETGSSTVSMNHGIVRNNIYRVEISGFTDEGIDLKIKVKKWDKFEHAPIYM